MAQKSTDMKITDLKKELSQGHIRSLYLFYGPENYIKEDYERKISNMVPDGGFPEFNHIRFEGTNTDLSEYDDAWEGLPMMTDRKLIIIRGSGIFKKASEEVKNFWQEKFSRITDDLVVIFEENEVDKRGILYKAVKKNGCVISFDYQSESDLVTWINRQALKAKIKMSKDAAKYMVNIIEPGLNTLKNEFDKLVNYCDGEITKADIDRVVSKSTQIQAFDLTNAIMKHDADTAMRVVNGLRTSKESAFGILYLMYNSAEKLLKAKTAGSRNKYEVAQITGMSPYIADLYISSSAGFSEGAIKRMVTRIPEIDFEIKSGRIDQWTAVEQYIAECIYYS